MIKKSSLSLVIGVLFILLILQNVLAVSSVSLRITGVVGDYSSKVTLRTDSNAGIGLDAYDMQAPSAPSSYSSFYSSITSGSLAIDSWNSVERDVDLYYQAPSGTTGDLVLSWNQVTGTNYKAYFSITGQTTLRRDMSEYSSYTYTGANASQIYVKIEIENYPTTTTTTTDSSSSGGGGTAAVVQQPQINLIFNISSDKLLFDAGIVITDDFKEIYTGEKMRSVINLQPMGLAPDLDVYLRYYITDENGREVDVGDGESETIKITGSKTLDKTFFTDNLESGEYTLHLELKYESEPGKFLIAEASSQFLVLAGARGEAGESPITLGAFSGYKLPLLVLGIAILILIILIIIVFSLTSKRIKKIKH